MFFGLSMGIQVIFSSILFIYWNRSRQSEVFRSKTFHWLLMFPKSLHIDRTSHFIVLMYPTYLTNIELRASRIMIWNMIILEYCNILVMGLLYWYCTASKTQKVYILCLGHRETNSKKFFVDYLTFPKDEIEKRLLDNMFKSEDFVSIPSQKV